MMHKKIFCILGAPIINITFANILSLAQVAQREKQKEKGDTKRER